MPEILGNIGSFFGSPAGKGLEEVAGIGATGAGMVGNLMADRQRAQAASLAQKNANLTPQQLSEMVKQGTQPLNAGLVQAVTGNVTSNLAEQGLSEAPGLIATAESQALAPFQQMNQQTALQLVLSKLGLPAEFARTIPPNVDMSKLIALLMNRGGSPPAGALQGAPFPTPPPPISDANTPGGGPVGDYNFGSLFAPNSGGV